MGSAYDIILEVSRDGLLWLCRLITVKVLVIIILDSDANESAIMSQATWCL